jgi:hypothetical protein
VAFSPDGRRLASAGQDQTVRVWDAATGQELRTLQGHTRDVRGVAFSPDGRRLASAGADSTVRVWDTASGQELLTLPGHTGWVYGVAYSPDGRRLASAGGDGTIERTGRGKRWWLARAADERTVRVWDAASGQELLTLRGHTGPVTGVAYSPDGRRLASAGYDATVRVWEASPVPPELWRRRGLVSDVQSLFDKLLLREEVVAALRKDATRSATDREFAVQVAQAHSENASALNEAAWKVVKAPDAGKDADTLALHQAEAADRLAPGDGSILNTLGVAQYRMGRYQEALATLTKSWQLNAGKDGAVPADLAFLAMAQHRLGQKERAQAMLGRLRAAMKQPRWANDAEARGFLREAEAVLQGKP